MQAYSIFDAWNFVDTVLKINYYFNLFKNEAPLGCGVLTPPNTRGKIK